MTTKARHGHHDGDVAARLGQDFLVLEICSLVSMLLGLASYQGVLESSNPESHLEEKLLQRVKVMEVEEFSYMMSLL